MTTDQRSPLWRVLILILSAIALGALVVAAACGGDDDDDDNGDNGDATATEPADGDDDDDDDTDAPTDEPDGDDDDDNGDDPFAEIEDLAGEYENATGTVTYQLNDDTGTTGEWTIYQDGDRSRVDFIDESSEFITITTPEASYTCFEDACYSGDGGLGVNPFAGLFTTFASSEAIFGYLEAFTDIDADSSSEDLAGVDASCYTLSGDFTGDEGTIKWCWADNGMLLLAQYDLNSGLFEMRATDFSPDVDSSVFEPPYDVTSLGQ